MTQKVLSDMEVDYPGISSGVRVMNNAERPNGEHQYDISPVDGFVPLAIIDRYKITGELGSDGFGTVYRARDTISGTDVAIKAVPHLISTFPDEIESIKENFRLVSRLHHPNIASLLVLHPAEHVAYLNDVLAKQIGISRGSMLVVMELAKGESLDAWRRKIANVPDRLRSEFVRQVASALDYAHSLGVLHCDVKPSNIMIEQLGDPNEPVDDAQFRVRLLDFGLAEAIHLSMGRLSSDGGARCGTRPYMAPEQWRGDHLTPAVDQYALAVVAYELHQGHVPFKSAFATGDVGVMYAAVTGGEPEFDCHIFAKEKAVILKGMSKEPSARFATCGDFAKALEASRNIGMDEWRDYMRTSGLELKAKGNLRAASIRLMAAEFGTIDRSRFALRVHQIEEDAEDSVALFAIDNQERNAFWIGVWFILLHDAKLGFDAISPLLTLDLDAESYGSLPDLVVGTLEGMKDRFGKDRIKTVLRVLIKLYPKIRRAITEFDSGLTDDRNFVEKSFGSLYAITTLKQFLATYLGVYILKKPLLTDFPKWFKLPPS